MDLSVSFVSVCMECTHPEGWGQRRSYVDEWADTMVSGGVACVMSPASVVLKTWGMRAGRMAPSCVALLCCLVQRVHQLRPRHGSAGSFILLWHDRCQGYRVRDGMGF